MVLDVGKWRRFRLYVQLACGISLLLNSWPKRNISRRTSFRRLNGAINRYAQSRDSACDRKCLHHASSNTTPPTTFESFYCRPSREVTDENFERSGPCTRRADAGDKS